ncbi:MAG: hypothetical protein IM669_10190 [Phenylobacterium sp.]|jgi:hypothetical protein|uniref:nucleoside-diphosphate kinase n=1 Tax=Phenylobacterium sp. TaxID=1871053 RepID=UPI0021778565|nr:nucleoside-diphosphate kinase [Phenylobacterium sp.]MCA3260087.1 hypothetical protein [Rubrivivax sp.]MCA3757878.1 hypothetical protein [Phenylobacterium sp.]
MSAALSRSPALERPRSWLQPLDTLGGGPRKRFAYAQESYFQEAYQEFAGRFRREGLERLHSRSFLIFKPDAAAGRCVEACLDAMAVEGLIIRGARLIRFTRPLARELWRYELNLSTYDRYPGVDALLVGRLGLLVLLEDPAREGDLSRRLSAWKGPSALARREAHHLRSRLGAGDGMLNFVHTPDETLDVLRELGVLFDREERDELFSLLTRPYAVKVDWDAMLQTFYGEIPRHSLDLREIRSRLAGVEGSAFDALVAQGPRANSFGEFERAFRARFPGAGEWDVLTVFLVGRDCEVPGIARALTEDGGPVA